MRPFDNSSVNSRSLPLANDIESSLPTCINFAYLSKDQTRRTLKLIFCFAGLQISYLLWGITQENLMTHEYKHGKFKNASLCVFGNRLLALLLSFALVVYTNHTAEVSEQAKKAPYFSYLPSSLSNTVSSWAQYECLKFVSFPSQVLSKSCKIIPVMLVGMLLHKKSYPVIEYVEAALITLGVSLFTLTEKSPGQLADKNDTVYGVSLLVLYLICDSFTSQWQSKIYKEFGVNQYQMMLGVNIWSMALTGLSLFRDDQFIPSITFLFSDSEALFHMIILSITSATGQLFIYYTIKEFGAVIFTIIMTTRQILSLIISCLLFSHNLGVSSWLSAIGVFCIVLYRIYRKGSD
eukprot:gene5625-7769_t